MSFKRLCVALRQEEVDYGVMAIENTLAGSILGNYALLEKYDLNIIGEKYLHVEQNLMALPGQSIADIKVVRSHPVAFLQCNEFLHKHPHMQPLEADDTAESAREIAEKKQTGIAAIASRQAAARYGLEILEAGIEDMKENFTRFLILANKAMPIKEDADKASLILRLKHTPGALAEALQIFKQLEINISLIQSVPIIAKPSEFNILIDLEHRHTAVLQKAIEAVQPLLSDLKVLGIYKK